MQPTLASRLAERVRPWLRVVVAGSAVAALGFTLGTAAVPAAASAIAHGMASRLPVGGSASWLAVVGITLGPLGLTFPCWATNAPSWAGRRRLRFPFRPRA